MILSGSVFLICVAHDTEGWSFRNHQVKQKVNELNVNYSWVDCCFLGLLLILVSPLGGCFFPSFFLGGGGGEDVSNKDSGRKYPLSLEDQCKMHSIDVCFTISFVIGRTIFFLIN